MRKHLPILPLISLKINGKTIISKCILLLIIVLVSFTTTAQDLKPQAIQQIKLLAQEKALRTPAQKKVDSRLLFAYKMQSNPALAKQLPDPYEIVTVPAFMPVTTPAGLTLAVVGALLLHAPPVDVVLSVVVPPIHTVAVPVRAAGGGEIVMVCVFDV